MFILKSTQQRCNPYAPYTDQDGTRYPRMPAELYEEISEPAPPAEYLADPELFFRTEQDSAPYVIYTPKSQEQVTAILTARYEAILDNHLDSVAQADRWDNRFTFVARAGYPNHWQQQAIAFGIWMDTCNAQAYLMLQEVIAGNIPVPTPEEFINSLPVFAYQGNP